MTPREFTRSERVAAQLHREIAQIIQKDVKNPDVGFVSVSEVVVTRDISMARVYVTVFNAEEAAVSIKALNKAAGFIRKQVGHKMRMRYVPELRFLHDASVETGARIDELIAKALHQDADHPDWDPDNSDNNSDNDNK
ncbi:MAG: 30S ribosome-binding factor RbfA [Xanthomonadales bacterium]|nr:30S ribosome-binding factor RbfA [Xanthomonadales bacterium]